MLVKNNESEALKSRAYLNLLTQPKHKTDFSPPTSRSSSKLSRSKPVLGPIRRKKYSVAVTVAKEAGGRAPATGGDATATVERRAPVGGPGWVLEDTQRHRPLG